MEVGVQGKAGLMTYVDVFNGAVKGPGSSAAAWSTIWFVLALSWLILAFWGSRRIGRD